MRRCTRCVLPQTYPGITFNADGVCNYCLDFGEDTPRGEEELRAVIRQHQGHGRDYDCLVALSGGRDSTYTLYYATKVLGLRVLAFTIDNGFLPPETRENIQNAIGILGVDHVVEKHDLSKQNLRPILLAWLHRPSPAMIPTLCVGCRLALYRGYLQTAKRYQIPLLLTGSGEPETSFATKFFSSSPSPTRRMMGLASGMTLEVIKNPRYLMKPTLPYYMLMEYMYAFNPVPTMQNLIYPEIQLVRLFEYIRWDEQQIMTLIQSELKWKNYSYSQSAWRSDCKINLLRNHLYKQTLGFTKNEELVSNLIRLGKIGREEGLARVEREGIVPEQFLREFFEEIRLPYDAYERSLPRMRERLNAIEVT